MPSSFTQARNNLLQDTLACASGTRTFANVISTKSASIIEYWAEVVSGVGRYVFYFDTRVDSTQATWNTLATVSGTGATAMACRSYQRGDAALGKESRVRLTVSGSKKVRVNLVTWEG